MTPAKTAVDLRNIREYSSTVGEPRSLKDGRTIQKLKDWEGNDGEVSTMQ